MRFSALTNSDKDYVIGIYNTESSKLSAQSIIAEKYGTTTRTIRNWAKRLGLSGTQEADEVMLTAESREIKGNRYMFTWGQISTPVHKEFFKYMKDYADHIDAKIGVIAGRYNNSKSKYRRENNEEWWDEDIVNFLTLNRHNVHKYVSILADVETPPTASMPMTGFEGFESEVSIVIGHPRVQMKVVPTLEGYRKKEIFTTGACTVPNYIKKKVGKKAEFHHTLGFVVIETDGDEFYMRHVTANEDGSFIDLDTRVDHEGITQGDNVELYACGDKHFGETDPEMELAGRAMILKLKPDYVRLDDIFNGHSVNPHEDKDPIQKYQRHLAGELSLKMELFKLRTELQWYDRKNFRVVIPRCNHDIFLDRYIAGQDWKKDIPNALSYMESATLLLRGLAPKGLIPYYIGEWYPDMITLSDNQSFRVGLWEQATHGHIGSSGTRGSVIQFKRLSTKMITAHTHTPSRYDGVVTVGTNTLLRVGYNKGASGWAHCDAITHRNGKAQQLIFHGYKCSTMI